MLGPMVETRPSSPFTLTDLAETGVVYETQGVYAAPRGGAR